MIGTQKPKVVLVRVEELAPFPMKETEEVLSKYQNKPVYWVQDENINSGAFQWVVPHLQKVMRKYMF